MAGRRPPKVSVYHRKREGYYCARWRENGRQCEEGGYPTRGEAEDAAHEISQRLRQGLPGIRAPRLVGEIIAHWWDTYVTTPSVTEATRQTYRIDARRILDTLGNEDANTTPGRIRQWRNEIATEFGPRSANKAHTALSSAYERALEAHPPLVETNPCRGVKRLPETRQAIIMPTRQQVAYLERTAPSARELAMLMIASRGGLRQSELLGLGWHNYRDGALWVSEVADVGRVIRPSTKTKRSERRVPLPEGAKAALDAIRSQPARGLMFPSPTDPTRPVSRSAWSKVYWKRWRRAAAWLAASEGEPPEVWADLLDMEWKNLRHHTISRWAVRASITQVSRWSGDSIATIDKHYAHLFDEDEANVMAAID